MPMLLDLGLLLLGMSNHVLSQQATITAEPTLSLPPGARVLHRFEGSEQDHLGISLACVGDVDRDGVSDLALGGMKYGRVGWGPGYGDVLYRVDGEQEPYRSQNDAFAFAITPLGDLDDDRIADLLIAAPHWHRRGRAHVISGTSGKTIRTHEGGHEAWPLEGLGAISRVGDIDRDAVEDYALDQDLYSGKTGKWLSFLPGRVAGATGDLDQDGRIDLLTVNDHHSGRPISEELAYVSSADGRILLAIRVEGRRGRLVDSACVGDVDGDGFADLAVAFDPYLGDRNPDASCFAYELIVLSGKTGATLLRWWQDQQVVRGQLKIVPSFGDLDRDGRNEIAATASGPAARAVMEIRSGRDGSVLTTLRSRGNTFGENAALVPDIDGDALPELLVSEFEHEHVGRVYVISLGTP